MKKRTITLLGLAAVAVFCLAVILVRVVSGGSETFARVSAVLQTHEYIRQRVGVPVKRVVENDGPAEVERTLDGLRSGYYSVAAEGPKGSAALKAYWRERPFNRSIQVYAIFSTKPFAQDELVWGKRE